jgi:hypothetical protein
MKKQTWEWEYLRTSPPKRKAPVDDDPTGIKKLFPGDPAIQAISDHWAAQPTSEDIQDWLNDLGADRWELVLQDGDTYTFKRPKVIDLATGIAAP